MIARVADRFNDCKRCDSILMHHVACKAPNSSLCDNPSSPRCEFLTRVLHELTALVVQFMAGFVQIRYCLAHFLDPILDLASNHPAHSTPVIWCCEGGNGAAYNCTG